MPKHAGKSLLWGALAALLTLALAAPFCGATEEKPAAPDIETDLRAIAFALEMFNPPKGFNTWNLPEKLAFWEQRAQKRFRLGEEIFARYPTNPRRWMAAAMILARSLPWYADAFVPVEASGAAPAGATIVRVEQPGGEPVLCRLVGHDAAQRQRVLRQAEQWKQGLLEAPDVPADEREDSEWRYRFSPAVQELLASAAPAETKARQLLERFEEFAQRHPAGPAIPFRVEEVVRQFAGLVGEATPAWEQLAQSEVAAVREAAARELNKRALLRKPVDMSFTAMDGREVDFQKLRGKVVLLDFWATWCGPCIAELPYLKEVYAKYHDRGFEIVGITLENANLRPGDSADARAAKLAAARKKLADFVAKEGLPWPQHFDGKFWSNDLALPFKLTGIPAMFLVDPHGNIVATDVRGERLETEVRRLLGG